MGGLDEPTGVCTALDVLVHLVVRGLEEERPHTASGHRVDRRFWMCEHARVVEIDPRRRAPA